ncbi:sugar ABC transporter permease, partial [Streptomyces sp. NPDC057067]
MAVHTSQSVAKAAGDVVARGPIRGTGNTGAPGQGRRARGGHWVARSR